MRCSRIPHKSQQTIERGKGIKRVDVLMRNRTFIGLTPGDNPHDMVLHLQEIQNDTSRVNLDCLRL